jgi:superfamily II RNA helicase
VGPGAKAAWRHPLFAPLCVAARFACAGLAALRALLAILDAVEVLPAPLIDRVTRGRADPDTVLGRFLQWLADRGVEPYPAQEEAFLELLAGRHVILGTPTGSGKTLVAALLHFRALCEWQRSFYTCPTKALASEKFFWMCEEFGAENVGMLTGDASINADAPILCCTTEILSNMALRRGAATPAPYVVMDEFHYYADRSRGTAWQIPLLVLSKTQFLLMSATLGDTSDIARRLHGRSGREVREIVSEDRPVPLDFSYSATPLHRTVEQLLEQGKAPIYIVHFTQREAAETAQALTSAQISSRAERARIGEAIGDFRFDTPYGRDLSRFLRFGVGVHHAGLLPKHRLLVEQLAQKGLLKVICGTDTLGVGVNIPIRTVLFARLCKYDGEKVGILTAREFRQIAGRAGRRGFDDRGSVVCQAPERTIARAGKAAKGKGGSGSPQRGRPDRRPGANVTWNEATFRRLIHQAPEPMRSSFRVTHGVMVNVLQRDPGLHDGSGYPALIDLIDRSHETSTRKHRLRREAARIFRSLHRAGILETEREPGRAGRRVRVGADLQEDFSLDHALSLYLVDALTAFDRDSETYSLDVLTLVESILENPMAILIQQERHAREELLQKLKAQGVPFEERIEQLDRVHYPQPNAELIRATFEVFVEHHPWVESEEIRPKSIAREMVETYASFVDYVRLYGIARIEGTLLRYLGDVYRTLAQNVPAQAKTEGVYDVQAFFRTLLERVDRSLLHEWESLRFPDRVRAAETQLPEPAAAEPDLARDPRAFAARIRAELHGLVRALSQRDYAEATLCVAQRPDDVWDEARFERALEPFYASYPEIVFTPRARLASWTRIEPTGHGRWDVSQVLLDPSDDNFWCVEGEVDLSGDAPEGPLFRLRRIGT